MDASSQFETIVSRGQTQSDAKSSADFRRIDCQRFPKWVLAAIQSMVGRRQALPSSAAVSRLLLKSGCLRLERQVQLRSLRERNLAALASPGSAIAMDHLLDKHRYEFVNRETYVVVEATLDSFYREKEIIETWSDQLHIDLDDMVTLVCILGLSSSPGESNHGIVPDEYLAVATNEYEGFLEWVYGNAYFRP